MVMVDTVYWLPIYRRTCGPGRLAWSKGRRPPGAISVFIAWTEWTLAMALPWWQHYKYIHAYYYIIIIIIIIIWHKLI